MHIKLLKTDSDEWRNFLKENEHLIVHTPEWKSFIEEAFPRTKAKYYAISVRNHIKLILPTFNTKLSLFPNVSSAFLEYGGPAGRASKPQILELKKKLPRNIEIRHGVSNKLLDKNFHKVRKASRFILPLKTEQEMWAHIHKFKRKAVRLAEKSGIVVKNVPENEIHELYKLYLTSMKDFGTPPYSKKYFANFYKFFVDRNLGKVLGAYYKGELIAVLTGFTVSRQIHININVSDRKYQKFRPNDALHWHFIKWGCNNKFKEFDFGRTREGSGQFSFKKKWNAELSDLDHYYISNPSGLSESSIISKLFVRVWRSVPVSVSKFLGPVIRESFGI